MNWFKPKYSICVECGVHFEPVKGYESRWGHLCQVHRKPAMDLAIRKEKVIAWAYSNWLSLEDSYLKSKEADISKYKQYNQACAQSFANQIQAINNSQHGLGPVFGNQK